MTTIVFRNQRAASTGQVLLIKVDCSCRTHRLAGAQFSLMRLDPEIGAYRLHFCGLVTDLSGQLRVEGLSPGRYRFAETAAPFGYKLTGAEKADFEVYADGTADCPVLVVPNCPACAPSCGCAPEPHCGYHRVEVSQICGPAVNGCNSQNTGMPCSREPHRCIDRVPPPGY